MRLRSNHGEGLLAKKRSFFAFFFPARELPAPPLSMACTNRQFSLGALQMPPFPSLPFRIKIFYHNVFCLSSVFLQFSKIFLANFKIFHFCQRRTSFARRANIIHKSASATGKSAFVLVGMTGFRTYLRAGVYFLCLSPYARKCKLRLRDSN